MERIETNNNGNHFARNFITTALLSSVLLGATSCGKTTQKDINEQKQKITLITFNVSHYINARKEVVNKYNTILKYPRTEANQYEIDNYLGLLAEQIEEYDKKIKNLSKDRIKAEKKLNKKIEDRGPAGIHSPVDPNKRDYLLTVQ